MQCLLCTFISDKQEAWHENTKIASISLYKQVCEREREIRSRVSLNGSRASGP